MDAEEIGYKVETIGRDLGRSTKRYTRETYTRKTYTRENSDTATSMYLLFATADTGHQSKPSFQCTGETSGNFHLRALTVI